MKKKNCILIVDDKEVNRAILKGILCKDYDTVEAENGQEAFRILGQRRDIAGILLDIIMPVMDGYAFLEHLSETIYKDLPVLVLTGASDQASEQRALDLGAWDFVPKPYSPQILLSRLKNAIGHSQLFLFEKLRYSTEHDALTDLYNRQKFFAETANLLDSHPDETFAVVSFNINRFRALNSFWGEQEGNRLLKYVANLMRRMAGEMEYCTYGRIEADIFAMCVPNNAEEIVRYTELANDLIATYKKDYRLEISFGVYVIEDRSMPVDTMYAKASLAVTFCKTEFIRLCYYRPEMSERVLQEQRIINEMQPALENGEFVVYLQPKYNLRTDLPYGAEALVRWQHPTRGLISPGEFIPVFESNGFIGKVDHYIWESVCRLLRKWTDEGQDPSPVSVNVSRVNLYNPNLISDIVGLVGKYNIPPRLLNLEITESAYMENPEIMQETVKILRQKGFIIMMDDFGSGYSSLNTLKDIHVDVLKIDMKFLTQNTADDRGTRILASVIRMAGWLELPVIVEGVETLEQKEFLESIGCGYVQGYFYARPMSVPDYEKLIRSVKASPVQENNERIGKLAETLWSVNPQVELLLQSIYMPIAVYEYDGRSLRTLRTNQAYSDFFGFASAIDGKNTLSEYLSKDSRAVIREALDRSTAEKTSVCCDFYREKPGDKTGKWLRMNIQYWGRNGNEVILFVVFNDVTKIKELDRLRKQLETGGSLAENNI